MNQSIIRFTRQALAISGIATCSLLFPALQVSAEPQADLQREPVVSPENQAGADNTQAESTPDVAAEAGINAINNAVSSQDKGLAIAREGDRRDNGFTNTTADLVMLLTNRNGESITREMRQKVLEVAGDGDKSIMVFDRPRDLKGAAILTYTHKEGVDDQWLYLPAIKRVKRISAADKSGPFMGSEFAYEDLASQEVEKYSYNYLRDETVDGDLCFVVERTPVDKNSGYTRQVAWTDQQEFIVRRIDYYDRKGDLLKTMRPGNYAKYLDQYWRALELHMSNHQTEKSTTLTFQNYKFRQDLSEADFTRNALARVK